MPVDRSKRLDQELTHRPFRPVSLGTLPAAALAFGSVPVLGDILGLVADAQMYAREPESRTPANFALSSLGLIPFVPGALQGVKRMPPLWHGTSYGSASAIRRQGFKQGESAELGIPGTSVSEDPEMAARNFAGYDGALIQAKPKVTPKDIFNLPPSAYASGQVPYVNWVPPGTHYPETGLAYKKPQVLYAEAETFFPRYAPKEKPPAFEVLEPALAPKRVLPTDYFLATPGPNNAALNVNTHLNNVVNDIRTGKSPAQSLRRLETEVRRQIPAGRAERRKALQGIVKRLMYEPTLHTSKISDPRNQVYARRINNLMERGQKANALSGEIRQLFNAVETAARNGLDPGQKILTLLDDRYREYTKLLDRIESDLLSIGKLK